MSEAEDLPRRAREARRRFDAAHKRFTEEGEALLKKARGSVGHLEERLAAGEDVEKEELEEFTNQVGEELEELREGLDQFRTAAEELDMIRAEAAIESLKIRSDALKHQATFAGVALAAIGTLTQVILPDDLRYVPLLGVVVVLLLYTICVSLILMHLEASQTPIVVHTGEMVPRRSFLEWFYWVAAGTVFLLVASMKTSQCTSSMYR